MYESSTISFVPCCAKDVSAVLWIEYSTPREFPYKSYRYMNLEDTNSVKKSFDLLLHAQRGCMSVNGLMFARKFEDPERIVMVRSYVMILPTAGLHIRCKHWTIVTPWKEGCFVQFFVQLYTESQEGFTALPADVEYVQEVALSTWSMKMHFYSKRLLDMLGDMADTGR
ncbi:hypothetical protein PHMEG_00021550 [Phytophthora megakarya]|uniref:Uncharacterized protein n=1 Tax=Phytophthora megakarya TaxID=4795 RepID=A0A225VM86_9STRA|nr:hypothetical protein PHMEG_00021550 [Phytophthora megakarya]